MIRSTEEWMEQYTLKGALWIHDGNRLRPHARLHSKKHSSGFFNSEPVLEIPSLLDEACYDLLHLLKKAGFSSDDVDRVVGPAMGAITLADNLARYVGGDKAGSSGQRSCLRAYTEKETKVCVKRDGNEMIIDYSELIKGDIVIHHQNRAMAFKRTQIQVGETVLLVEDVLTTGNSVDLSAAAVTEAGGVVLPFVAVLVNRSGLTDVNGRKVVALIDRIMPQWEPDDCPLCKQGSEALRPKGKENWARLRASY